MDHKFTVELIDVLTGVTTVLPDEDDLWSWTESNYSCDCNRATAFGNDDDTGVCLGCERYLVKSVTPMPAGYCLADFNNGYAPELRAQWSLP